MKKIYIKPVTVQIKYEADYSLLAASGSPAGHGDNESGEENEWGGITPAKGNIFSQVPDDDGETDLWGNKHWSSNLWDD